MDLQIQRRKGRFDIFMGEELNKDVFLRELD